jgi:signal transduction histidine kinase
VRVSAEGGELRIAVEDDGRGFDPEETAHGHVGLKVMQERAAMIGARLTVESGLQLGTRVVVSVPVAADRRVGGPLT